MHVGLRIAVDGRPFVVTSVFSRPDTYFVRPVAKSGNEYGRFTHLYLNDELEWT